MQVVNWAAVVLLIQHILRQIGKHGLVGLFCEVGAELPDGYWKDVSSKANFVQVAKGLGKASP